MFRFFMIIRNTNNDNFDSFVFDITAVNIDRIHNRVLRWISRFDIIFLYLYIQEQTIYETQ